MESQLDNLIKYASILESYTENAHRCYDAKTQRPEDLPLALERLKEEFYKLFPEAKKE